MYLFKDAGYTVYLIAHVYLIGYDTSYQLYVSYDYMKQYWVLSLLHNLLVIQSMWCLVQKNENTNHRIKVMPIMDNASLNTELSTLSQPYMLWTLYCIKQNKEACETLKSNMFFDISFPGPQPTSFRCNRFNT